MAPVVLLAEPLLVDVLGVLDVLGALVERLAAELALELVLVRHLVDAELGVGVEHPGVGSKCSTVPLRISIDMHFCIV